MPNPSGDGAANLMMASRAVYNILGQVKERYDAQLNKTQYFYEDANKNLTKTIDAEGHVVEMRYNNLDQMDWKKEYLSYPSSFVLTQFTYDDNGNMKTVVDPRLKTYTYNYDASNRLVSIAYPIAGHTESWVYDADGNLFTHTDPNGKVATYTYDDLGRAIAEQHGAPYNVTISRTYEDDLHRVTIDDGSISKVMDSNTLNRLTGVQYHVGGQAWKSISYGYDDAGLRTSMVDPEGNVYSYAYTPNSQLASISRNSSFAIQNSYDSGGRKIRSDLGNGTSMRYTYDNKERVTNVKAIRSQGDVVSSFSYVYNKIDNRMQMKLDHENVLVNYGYDGTSRLTSESWNLGAANPSCNNQYTAQPQGNESGFSNVAKATPTAGILTSPFLSYYTYDSAGNRTAKYTLSGGSSYAVDDENRLTTEQPFSVQALTPVTTTTQDNWVELDFGALVAPFRLDVALPNTTNRFKIQYHDGTTYQDISFGAALGANLEQDGYYRPFSQDCRFLFVSIATQKIRYYQESGSAAGVSLAAYTIVNGTPIAYAHDANGNMTSRTQGTTVETYAHDYANRIVTYSDQQVAYSYIFAPSGERMAKVNPDLSAEWYMYDGDDVVADYALPSGGAYALTATYANGLGIDSKVARFDPSGAPSYYIPDALGSVHRILDGAQHVVNTYLTNAWGESLISQEGIPNRYGFTQRERDPESSLMHYRARSYDPRLGRFVQRDPSGMVDGPNRFSYVRSNPIIRNDPSGKRLEIAGEQISVHSQFYNDLGDRQPHKEIADKMMESDYTYQFKDEDRWMDDAGFRERIIEGMERLNNGPHGTEQNQRGQFTVPPSADTDYWMSDSKTWLYITKKGVDTFDAMESFLTSETHCECLSGRFAVVVWAASKMIGQTNFVKKYKSIEINAKEGGTAIKFLKDPDFRTTKDILPGDMVRFKNAEGYARLHPFGDWEGENAIYVGFDMYSGFGAADMTKDDMRNTLLKQYNDGIPANERIGIEKIPEPKLEFRPTLYK